MIHTLQLAPDWKLINLLSEIDKFGGSWAAIEKREGQTLKQLKSIATVRSVGASTRIEGAKMTDDEVQVFLENLKVSKLEERDQQEVAGYFEALDTIAESYPDIEISESTIKGLHNILMRYSEKDQWHKGNYKLHSNVVEATRQDGTKYVVFQTSSPGFETDDAMRNLVQWYNSDKEAHSIVRAAVFVYEFLSIHPFQDGNGRLSRLIGTLLLLKHAYRWVQYVSFEHEIENRKPDYYKVLMECQRNRPGENVYPWVTFFLGCLSNIQEQLMIKLETRSTVNQMTPKEKKIFQFVENHPGARSGEIAQKLKIPLPTVKRIIGEMVTQKLLDKHGIGAGTNYTIQSISMVKKDLLFTLTSADRKKEFSLSSRQSFVELKKIILAPRFDWRTAPEWSIKLASNDLSLRVSCFNNRGGTVIDTYSVMAYNHPTYHQPVFTLSSRPIVISSDMWDRNLTINDYPVRAVIELIGETSEFDFDVNIVFDALVD
jgi:Fic family protein